MYKSKRQFELSPRLKLGVGRNYSQNSILKFSAILCLLVAIGLAVNAFRLILSGNSALKTNPLQTGNAEVLGATDNKIEQSEKTTFSEYKVQKGDTLFNISQKLNVSWSTIASINNLKSPFFLKPGQIIKIVK